MKTCSKCAAVKPLTEFHVSRKNTDGHAGICKVCTSIRTSTWHVLNREKVAARKALWYAENRDEALAKSAAYQRTHPEKGRARTAKYNKAHPEKPREWARNNKDKVVAKTRRWQAANPAAVAAISGKRRAQKLKACPPWADHEAIKAKYKEARRLTRYTGIKHQVDHEVPLIHPLVCGLHVPANLRAIPATDNMSKHNYFEVA